MKTINEIEAQLGARGSASILSGASGGRDLARQWLQLHGVSRDTAARLVIADINAIYNDTTDAKLDALRLGAHTTPVGTQQPASGVDALLQQLRDALTAKPAASGVDEARVRDIAEDVVSTVDNRVTTLADSLKPLFDLAARAAADATAAKRVPVLAAAASGNHILDKLIPHYKPGTESNRNILLTAPPSFGKSYSIRKLGASYDTFVEHGCSEDIDEVSTLLGNTVPDGKGGFTVFDGKLTHAVREAASGKNVLFFFDEITRIADKAEQALLTFLTGVKTPAGRVYRLTTRRVTPAGTLEELECPAERLHFIAAANLELRRPSAPLWSRFNVTIRLDWNVPDCTAVATAILNERGITHTPAFAEAWANLMNSTRQLVKTGELVYPVCFRFLEAAAQAATTPDEAGVRDFVAANILNRCASWDGDLGDTDRTCESTLTGFLKEL